MKTTKVNIGMEQNLKLAIVGVYWDEETIARISHLLREYQYLFPNILSKMKGIVGRLGEMKIPLKLDVKPIKQRSCRLNLKYKEKIKEEHDKMLPEGIVEPMEESKWIIPIVIHEKKIGGIRLCVDLINLNDAYGMDPFFTPFTVEVLESVGGKETYSFTY